MLYQALFLIATRKTWEVARPQYMERARTLWDSQSLTFKKTILCEDSIKNWRCLKSAVIELACQWGSGGLASVGRRGISIKWASVDSCGSLTKAIRGRSGPSPPQPNPRRPCQCPPRRPPPTSSLPTQKKVELFCFISISPGDCMFPGKTVNNYFADLGPYNRQICRRK